jgi:hypothetical protein
MIHAFKSESIPVFYVPKYWEYGVAVDDGGTSKIVVAYCPWCGTKLPSSLRDEWFDEIESLGFEPDDKGIPKKYQTDSWWKKRR